MIYEGKNGSLNVFLNDLLICSFPLTDKKTYERYKYQGEYYILNCFKENINIKQQIEMYYKFCNIIYVKKKNKRPIWRSDLRMFMSMIFALIKLKIIDEDDHILICKKKKQRKINN